MISWQRTLLVPIAGGDHSGADQRSSYVGRFKGQLADAIEANALYGGRVSMRGSLLISIQTLLSNGFGGSVGLEAGYTQICAAFSSQIGQRLAARRADMRLLVACGAAGAISAAFSAPLAGAFFAFEVVLGAYTVGRAGAGDRQRGDGLAGDAASDASAFLMVPGVPSPVSVEMIGQTMVVGVICAFFSIVVMLAVAFSERVLPAHHRLRGALRFVLGARCSAGLGAVDADRARLRPRRDADPAGQQSDLADAGDHHRAEDRGVGDLARRRLSRRPVLRLADAGRR